MNWRVHPLALLVSLMRCACSLAGYYVAVTIWRDIDLGSGIFLSK